jgi:hypothetical protein
MEDEYSALLLNGTSELVPPQSGFNLIYSSWIFNVKLLVDGSIERYKVRLVAKTFKHRYGLDCEETFNTVFIPVKVSLLLSLAMARG